MDQNGNSRSESSVPPPPPQHPEVASGSNSHPYPRKERSPSPRSYRRPSYSPRRRSPSPRSGYRNGREDRYREDRYVREDRYDRGYSRGGSGGYREERSYPYGSERRGPPRRSKPVDRGSDKERRDSTTLYVGNLPYSFREQDVADMFERYGRLRKVTVQIDHHTGRNKGFAFVEFEDRRDAEDAYDKYNGTNVEGRRLKLDWDIGLGKKDQHRRDKHVAPDNYGRSAEPYTRGASPLGLRGFSPNYRTGGRSPSPYRR